MNKNRSLEKIRDEKLGKKIKDAMSMRGVSVKALSETTHIEPQTIYSILNGHHQPSLGKLESMCNALRVSLDDLLELEVNTLSLFPQGDQESLDYARFEDIWFGPEGGERISISRSFSMANYSEELRESILRGIEQPGEARIALAMDAFRARQDVIHAKEKRRIEVVTDAGISEFIRQRPPYDRIPRELIVDCVEGIIRNIREKPLDYEMTVIPGLYHRVNYEIINREVILFNLGTIYLRQTHKSILDHFLREVSRFKTELAMHAGSEDVAAYLRSLLETRPGSPRGHEAGRKPPPRPPCFISRFPPLPAWEAPARIRRRARPAVGGSARMGAPRSPASRPSGMPPRPSLASKAHQRKSAKIAVGCTGLARALPLCRVGGCMPALRRGAGPSGVPFQGAERGSGTGKTM